MSATKPKALIARLPGWVEAMNAAIAAAETRPFDWQGWCCADFTADIVLAMTGVDALADYRGKFEDEASAWAALAARDGSLRAACSRIFGNSRPAAFAQRGDVVLLRGGKGLGVCVGRAAAFASDDGNGLVRLPMTRCSRSFALGWPDEVMTDE